jgi:DNA (cytosine-5)-methyltransferase 1
MNYLSVCSGIEAATVAWHDMGWNPVGFSEIEKFPSQLLAHHYPNVTNYGDMTKFKEWNINDTVELLVGGTPCQSFSIAGLRKGLEDPRGNLMLTYLAMADHFKPKWLLWENVPGVLSSNRGSDFAALLQGLAELGYGFAYRVLDAQHFGVPQRRRRVFVVGCLGDWRSAAKVLFESESLCRDITPGRSERKEIANCLTKSPSSYSSFNPARSEGNAVVWPAQLASKLNASFGSKMGLENQHINSGAPLFIPVHARDGEEVLGTLTASYGTGGADLETKPLVHNVAFTTEQTPKASIDLAHTLTSSSYKHNQCVAYNITFCDANGTRKDRLNGGLYVNETDTSNTLTRAGVGTSVVQAVDTYNGTIQGDVTATMTASMAGPTNSGPKVMSQMRVRRLTPMECERLQGFPDNYTNTPTSSDATRYKALGNSMAVPVMKWIGERINEMEKMG